MISSKSSFSKRHVHPSDQKIDQISLLKFVISKAAQSFQHFRHLSVKIVEALYLGDTLAVAVQKICVAGHRHQLCFYLLIGSALRARVGYGGSNSMRN